MINQNQFNAVLKEINTAFAEVNAKVTKLEEELKKNANNSKAPQGKSKG